MLSTYLRADDNTGRDYVLALGHHVNLFRAPYCVRDPLRLYGETGQNDQFLGLWELDGRPLVTHDGPCLGER